MAEQQPQPKPKPIDLTKMACVRRPQKSRKNLRPLPKSVQPTDRPPAA